VAGAAGLGIVHAPGYPLIAHCFMLLPIGDPAFRVNLLSALSLALTAPILYACLYLMVRSWLIAAATTLTFMWSYFVWNTGVATEINARHDACPLANVCPGWVSRRAPVSRNIGVLPNPQRCIARN
jgi:hypothetical protein